MASWQRYGNTCNALHWLQALHQATSCDTNHASAVEFQCLLSLVANTKPSPWCQNAIDSSLDYHAVEMALLS